MAAQQTYGGYFVHQASLRHSVHGMAARVSMHVGAGTCPGDVGPHMQLCGAYENSITS